jgi:hypothetical protein
LETRTDGPRTEPHRDAPVRDDQVEAEPQVLPVELAPQDAPPPSQAQSDAELERRAARQARQPVAQAARPDAPAAQAPPGADAPEPARKVSLLARLDERARED